MRFSLSWWIVAAVYLAPAAGCASVPGEGSQLSAELGQRIGAIEVAHIRLLRNYMDLRRERVDAFIEKEWLPAFASNYLNDPAIAPMLSQATASDMSDADRLQAFTIISEEAQDVIARKREELVEPLDEMERVIERRLKDEYGQAKAMNAAVTGLLASATHVADARSKMLESFGVGSEDLANFMGKFDEAIDTLDNFTEADDAITKFNEFKADVEAAIDGLKGL